MRVIAVLTTLILASGFSGASAGVIISDIGVEAGVFSQEYNTFWVGAPENAGTDWGIPVGSGTSSVNTSYIANMSSVSFDVQQQGPNEIVEFAWDHSITGVTEDEAYGYAYVQFTPDVDLHYEISGLYAVNGSAASYQFTILEDSNSHRYLRSSKESRSTPNETLVVGSPFGGDYRNNVNGSLNGDLMAGEFYTLFNIWYLHAHFDSAPSVATGNLRLTLSPLNTAAVPEPSSLLLLGIGACGLLLRSRRAKQTPHAV